MTNKRRLAIADDDGSHIMAVYVEPGGEGFEGADLSGLSAIGIQNLRGGCFRGAVLYWANLARADLSGCNFENSDMCGAVLDDALAVNANFRGARLCRDNLGGATSLQGADFTGAELEGADLNGAKYDKRTKFPKGFNPTEAGCIFVDTT